MPRRPLRDRHSACRRLRAPQGAMVMEVVIGGGGVRRGGCAKRWSPPPTGCRDAASWAATAPERTLIQSALNRPRASRTGTMGSSNRSIESAATSPKR